jgi:asparagine synthetase B (glutamine-hydrolysing)
MCGLSAIVKFEPGNQLLPCLLSMHRCIPHRGPDGEGFALLDSALTASARAGHSIAWVGTRKRLPQVEQGH